jgi:hypothetical protein
MHRLLIVLTHAALRLVMSFMMAAGGGALVAVVFAGTQPPADWADWFVPVRQAALGIGCAFLGSAVLARVLLPWHSELTRAALDGSEEPSPAGVLPMLAALAGVSAWHFPTVLAWWDVSRQLAMQMTAGERDPLGYWIVPEVILSAGPFIAALIVALFILSAILAAVTPSRFMPSVLGACVLLQSGLVIGSTLALTPIRNLTARILSLLESSPDAGVLTAITEAVTRQDVFATGLLLRFQWILGGFVLSVLLIWYWRPFRNASGSLALPPSDVVVPPLTVVAGAPAVPVDAASISLTSSVFASPMYRVRLRTHWILAAFRMGYLDYAITPVPARASEPGFFFSGKDGALRRESGGRALLEVQPEGGASRLRSSYAVTEASSGDIMGILEPAGVDWNVLDRFRRLLAQAERVDARPGYVRYCLRVDRTEVCRFTWAMHGFGVWTAEMDVEFSNPPLDQLDRAYAMALAPILELQARRASQRMHS